MTCTCPLYRPAPVRSPLASLPGWDIAERIVAEQHNAAVLSNIEERSAWCDTFPDHAADLANAVAGLADELQRGCG